MILIHCVAYSQTSIDTICLNKKQAQKIVNTIDSLNNMAKVLTNSNNKCDSLVIDLQNEIQAYKEKDNINKDIIKDKTEMSKRKDLIIKQKNIQIKKQKKRFRILGGSSGGAFIMLVLLVLL